MPSDKEATTEPIEILIVTGLSGSGKSTAIEALEDLGYFCIDNLPVPLLPDLLNLVEQRRNSVTKIGVGIDTRGAEFLDETVTMLANLDEQVDSLEMLFLEADDDILVRRFRETRRRHPMDEADTVRESIQLERQLLEELRTHADTIVDTTQHTVPSLKDIIWEQWGNDEHPDLQITLMSFGFKYGLPTECDLVFDVRFLPNPHYDDELQPLTGKSPRIKNYVFQDPDSSEFLSILGEMMEFTLPKYREEGKSYLTIGIGCTGGKHRSVAVSDLLAQNLEKQNWTINLKHRDIGNE